MIIQTSRGALVCQRGLSLVELMVAITLGLLLLAGLVAVFTGSSRSYAELQKSAQQIENGRYAIDVVADDLRHAGYYGDFAAIPAAPATLPDPCGLTAADLTTSPYSYLAIPVQGYDSPASSPIAACLASSDHVAGTDILILRRADSESTSLPTLNDVYIQSNPGTASVQFGNPAGFALGRLNSDNTVAVVGTSAGGATTGSAVSNPATVLKKSNILPTASPISGYRIAADIRKLHVHIYFVAPCSRPNGGGATCTGAADDNGNPIPTLKRLELTSNGGAAPVWNVVPIAEGIENFQVEYEIDDTPAAVNPETQLPGDGAPDRYVADPTLAQFANAVSARIYLLARNPSLTVGHSDGKTYCMTSPDPATGSCPAGGYVGPLNDAYKRHLFTAEVRLVNPSSRREIP
jgi:type IV pilus assembly protein PilW